MAISIRPLIFVAFLLSSCGNLPDYGPLDIQGNASQPEASHQIKVTTWNVGYGALGADADFVADGGEHMRALSSKEISLAVQEISREVGGFDAEFILFQELANSSILTRSTPVRTTIARNLPAYSSVYWEDLGVSAPPPLQVSHGMGVYALNEVEGIRARELPQEPGYFFLTIKRYYAAIVTEIPLHRSAKNWVLLNIHLSAFDKNADVRRAQVQAVFNLAQAEYRAGNYVVIGGDWNMRISPKNFTHTTDAEDLFWVHDFPKELLPKGWQFATDDNTPTVRTLHKPYVEGENYTAIMDGFAYSPNVVLRQVSTKDLGFQYTDHQPVTAVFATR